MRVPKLIILLSLVAGAFVTVTSGYSAPRSSNSKINRAANTPSNLPPGDFARDPGKDFEVATLAGGCFWGMEEIIRKLPGVKDTQVGYTGGRTSNPSYKEVSSGKTGHAEAIQVIFDPKLLSFEHLLGFYFRMHDPTTLDQQGNDKGTQYRSAIFYYTETQAKTAQSVRSKLDKLGRWKKPIVTEIAAAQPFWRAELEHQDYLQKNPNGYTCHYLRDE
jgi:methionine-S-sulfoxide reductase